MNYSVLNADRRLIGQPHKVSMARLPRSSGLARVLSRGRLMLAAGAVLALISLALVAFVSVGV